MDSSLHSQMSTSTDNTTIAQAQTTSSTNHPNPTLFWFIGVHRCLLGNKMLVKRAILVTDKRRFLIKSGHSAKSAKKISTCRNFLPDRFWLPICFQDELGYTRMVMMNWDFVAILKSAQSGTNRRLWDRGVSR